MGMVAHICNATTRKAEVGDWWGQMQLHGKTLSLYHIWIYILKNIYIIECGGGVEEEKRDRDLYHLKSAASF